MITTGGIPIDGNISVSTSQVCHPWEQCLPDGTNLTSASYWNARKMSGGSSRSSGSSGCPFQWEEALVEAGSSGSGAAMGGSSGPGQSGQNNQECRWEALSQSPMGQSSQGHHREALAAVATHDSHAPFKLESTRGPTRTARAHGADGSPKSDHKANKVNKGLGPGAQVAGGQFC